MGARRFDSKWTCLRRKSRCAAKGVGADEPRTDRPDRARPRSLRCRRDLRKERPLRLVYLGRLDPTKGVHVLIEALQLGKSLPVTLDIYGNSQGESGAAYADRLQKLAMGDGRVEFKASVPCRKSHPHATWIRCVAVPSQWLETGPLVVLEAFAAGIPVIGSNLGGIAELVNEGVNGFLVNANGADAWYQTLKRLCADSGALANLHRSISRPPTMSAVAQTMIRLYQRLLAPLHASA